MLCPREGYELPTTQAKSCNLLHPHTREGRTGSPWPELKFHMAVRLGWRKSTQQQGTPRAIDQAKDQEVKRGRKLPKDTRGSIPSCIQSPEPRATRPRARTGGWRAWAQTRAGVENVQLEGHIRSEKSCGLGLPR